MADWSFEHSFHTSADRSTAWRYWADLKNHAEQEPGVERIELDGPFAGGTKGRTIAEDYTQEWELVDVVNERRFTIKGWTDNGEGWLSFTWSFADENGGTRMTHRIEAGGPQVEKQSELFEAMEQNAPKGMALLRDRLDELARGK